MKKVVFATLMVSLLVTPIQRAYAQTPQQWVEWGDRVHGGFGSLIAYGFVSDWMPCKSSGRNGGS